MTADVVMPDIKHVADVTAHGPLPRLLAPYVTLYGPLHVYADNVTGHLFVRTGNGGFVTGAEQFFFFFNDRACSVIYTAKKPAP